MAKIPMSITGIVNRGQYSGKASNTGPMGKQPAASSAGTDPFKSVSGAVGKVQAPVVLKGQSVTGSAQKTPAEYSKDYMAARAAGDWQGMQTASDGANAWRTANGQPTQDASADIALIRNQSNPFTELFQSLVDQGGQYIQKLVQNVQKPQEPQEPQEQADYDLSEYLRKQEAARLERALAGLKGAYTRSVAGYDAALDRLPQTYQAARNDAAAQTAMAQKNFDERAAASGLNSGASGQAALDASAVYRGTLAQLDQEQANAAADISRAKADLRAQYETAIAQAQADGDATLAQALYQEMARVQGLERQDEQTAYDREQDALSWEYKRQKEADAKALDSAMLLANQGSFDALGAYYGWDANTVERMNQQYQMAQARAAMSEAAVEAKTRADNMIKMGLMPDAATLERAGYDLDYAQRLSGAYAAKLTSGTKSGKSGTSGTRGNGSDPVGPAWTDVSSIYQQARTYGGSDPESWIRMNYKTLGIPYNSVSNVAAGYQDWLRAQVEPVVDQVGQVVTGAMPDLMKGLISGEAPQTHGSGYTSLLTSINGASVSSGVNRKSYFTPKIEAAYRAGQITAKEADDLLTRVGNY